MSISRNHSLHRAVVALVTSIRLPEAFIALQLEDTHLVVTATDSNLQGLELADDTCEGLLEAASVDTRTSEFHSDEIPTQLDQIISPTTTTMVVGAIIGPTGVPLGFVVAYGPEPALEQDCSRVQYSIEIIERHLDDKQEQKAQRATGMSLKIASDKLQRYSEKLKFQNENLDLFAEFTAHEVKNPLRAIMLCADYIQTKLNSGSGGIDIVEVTGMLAEISDEAQVLYDQIENILALGKPEPNYRRSQIVNLGEVAEQTFERYGADMSRIGATVEFGTMVDVACDPAQLLMVLSNLVSNAIRYRSPKRALIVRVDATIVGNEVRITVSDNGIGIERENQDRIFDAYTRCSPDQPGLGLGLALSRRSLEQAGGSIEVDSEVGVGSTFTVVLSHRTAPSSLTTQAQ